MLIVIPVSESDSNLSDDFCNALKFFGDYKQHDLLVVSRPSDSLHAVKVFSHLGSLFKKCNIHFFESDGVRGWPSGPNFYWKKTIEYLKSTNNTLPWLWMELDMTPVKFKWIDALEFYYKKSNKPCMGYLQDTTTLTASQKVVKIGSHLVGAAIYPADISSCCTIWQYVDEINIAFDVLCQNELVANSTHSDLFQHNFRTKNYRARHGLIVGEDHNNFPDGMRFDEPLSDNVVIVHGCDDGSLSKVITSYPIDSKAFHIYDNLTPYDILNKTRVDQFVK